MLGYQMSQHLKVEAAVEQLAPPVEPTKQSFKMREPDLPQILIDEFEGVPRNTSLSPLAMHDNFKVCL